MDRSFYARAAEPVAKDLLGCHLVHDHDGVTYRGRIVETEAYYGDDDVCDPASHAFTGETARNQVMFGPAGQSYVYVCYGIHNMLNVVTGDDGEPGAVLLRAVEPVDGIDAMHDARGVSTETALCSGPGKLCEAFSVTTEHNDVDLTGGDLRIESGERDDRIVTTTRIGLSKGEDLPFRFYEAGNPHVSRSQ